MNQSNSENTTQEETKTEQENNSDKNIEVVENEEKNEVCEQQNTIENTASDTDKNNNDSDYCKKRAETHMNESKYQEALEAINKAISVDSENAELYYKRALLFQEIGDDENYLKNIQTTLLYAPEHKLAYISRVNYFVKKSDFLRAYQDALTVIELVPTTENKYLLAQICFNLKKYQTVITILKQIYEDKKQEKEIDFYIGMSLALTDNIDEAGPYLINSVTKGISDKDVFYFLTQFYYDKKSYDLALENIERVLALMPTDYKMHLLKAKICFELNDFEKAFGSFDEAIKLNPNDKDLLISKAEYLERNNEINKCIDEYSKLISMYPTDVVLYFKRATLYKKVKNIDCALKDLSKAKELESGGEGGKKEVDNIETSTVEQGQKTEQKQQDNSKEKIINKDTNEENVKIDPQKSMIHLSRAKINFKKNNYDMALSDVTEAIKNNPKDTQGYLLRAEIYIQLKKEDDAICDLLKSIDISKSVLAYIKLADIYRLRNDFIESEAYYKKAININPRAATAYFGYAMLCEQYERKDMAIHNYQEASKLDIKLSKECNARIKNLQ